MKPYVARIVTWNPKRQTGSASILIGSGEVVRAYIPVGVLEPTDRVEGDMAGAIISTYRYERMDAKAGLPYRLTRAHLNGDFISPFARDPQDLSAIRVGDTIRIEFKPTMKPEDIWIFLDHLVGNYSPAQEKVGIKMTFGIVRFKAADQPPFNVEVVSWNDPSWFQEMVDAGKMVITNLDSDSVNEPKNS